MRSLCVYVCLIASLAAKALAGVAVSSPSNGATLGSPVSFVATAGTSTCSKGVASMGVWINDSLKYVVNGTSLNTKLTLNPGTQKTVIQEWDYCGGSTFATAMISVPTQSGVFVSSPANNSTVGPAVHYSATASATCSKGVSAMGVYVDNQLLYSVPGATLNTVVTVTPGTHKTVVEEWDYCGGATFTPLTINVTGNILSNIQASGGWKGWGELAPAYEICSNCSPKVTLGMTQSSTSTRFDIGGSVPYSDVLWTNPIIGQGSTQGLPDNDHTLVPNTKNFIYDAWFFSSNLPAAQVLEFDVSQYFSGKSFIFGNQCRIAGGNEWDIWDNVNNKWVATGVACNPTNNAWNHIVIQVQRTWDNQLFYQSITLNGVTSPINKYYGQNSAPSGWLGITLNFQMDGNYKQSPYTIYLDKLNFTYW
jgi:hypothetical protein